MKMLFILIMFLFIISSVNAVNYGLCYQETANISTSCGGLDTGNYSIDLTQTKFIINYTKPVFSNNAIWRVKHGYPAQDYNISIPFDCYNQSYLTLKIYSYWHWTYQTAESSPYCFNGTDWKMIGVNTSGISGSIGGGSGGFSNLFDGDYNTQSTFVNGNSWYNDIVTDIGGNPNNASVFEESIYWNMTVNPLVPNQIDFSKFNYIRQYGKILSNHNSCIDNTTLGHNITYVIKIDNNQSTINVWAYEPCEFGCDLSTNRCNESKINQYLTVGLILLIIVVIVIILIVVTRR